MLSCKETARLLSESMERPLPFRRRLGLRLHLMMCYLCRRYARQVRAIDQVVRRLSAKTGENGEDPAGLGELSPEARDRVKTALREES
jgi:hypothetical protein